MSTRFKSKNSLRTIKAQIVQKLKNNEARPKFTGSYKKKRVPWKNLGSYTRVFTIFKSSYLACVSWNNCYTEHKKKK